MLVHPVPQQSLEEELMKAEMKAGDWDEGTGMSIGYLTFSATPPSKEHHSKEGIRFQEYSRATSSVV